MHASQGCFRAFLCPFSKKQTISDGGVAFPPPLCYNEFTNNKEASLMSKQIDFLFDAEICVMFADKGVFSFSDQILHFPVKRFERIAFTGRHPSNDGLFCTDMESSDQLFGDIAGVKNK
jgi:hypothetical protein